MRFVVFGLTVSSSWGNGHATLWRGIGRALAKAGHKLTFFERDVPYYANTRDLYDLPCGDLHFYQEWEDVRRLAEGEIRSADAAIVTSYCPDAIAAAELILSASRPVRIFYDLDTPVTLSHLSRGEEVPYVGPRGLRDFDLVLSYTGGTALDELRDRLGARQVAPLYGHVDPEAHRRIDPVHAYRSDLSYIGTFAPDRQDKLQALFVDPARRRPLQRFVIAGAQYPPDFPWSSNIYFVRHLPPSEHPAFYSSSRLTLNVTRQAMASMGWCPSGRLFEAAACGTAMLSDDWDGLDHFFEPGSEILVTTTPDQVVDALDMDDSQVRRIGAAARERVLAEHTSEHRVRDLIAAVESRTKASVEA